MRTYASGIPLTCLSILLCAVVLLPMVFVALLMESVFLSYIAPDSNCKSSEPNSDAVDVSHDSNETW